jgi:hypothetical protein
MVRRKVMFPRKEAWSTLCKSARFDLQTTGVDAFRLHGSSASVSSHFEMPQYRVTRDPIPPQARHTPLPVQWRWQLH